jgi:DNA-binding MarR family transcriptional regulator
MRLVSTVDFEEVSKHEFAMLMKIASGEKENKPLTVANLAKELNVSPPAISRMLKNMAVKGLVVKKIDKACLRNVNIFLTDRGKEIIEKNIEICREKISSIIKIFDRDEIDMLLKIQDKFIDYMKDKKQL